MAEAAPRRTQASPTRRSSSAAPTRSAARPRPTARSPRAPRRTSTFVNDKGGVDGRKINFKTIDDGYEPPRALQNAKRLIQQDKVFALFNTLGTPNNLAIWDYVNQQKVPQLYVATGASDWGKDIKAHPYTIGWQPNYVTEAKVYAEYLKKKKPNAKVAVLYQNDGFGKDLLGGFEEAIAGSGIKVVDKESYNVTDPTVSAQMGRLARSGADTFLNITTPKFSAQAIAAIAKSDWKPLHILNNVGASKTLVLDAGRPREREGHRLHRLLQGPRGRAVGGRCRRSRSTTRRSRSTQPKTNSNDAFAMYGWTVAQTMAKALEQMKEPTRDSLMDAVRNMDLGDGHDAARATRSRRRRTTAIRSRRCRSSSSTARTGSSRAT